MTCLAIILYKEYYKVLQCIHLNLCCGNTVVTPTFTTTPQNADLGVGGDVTLTCSATGVPAPQIMWERTNQTGGRMLVPGSDINALRSGDLPLTNLQQGDTGLYHCVADNQVDRIESSAMIRIGG